MPCSSADSCTIQCVASGYSGAGGRVPHELSRLDTRLFIDIVSWTDHVDGYCERLDPGLWAEPANALSNIAFLAAAIALWRLAATMRTSGQPVLNEARVLPLLVLLVAIGSALFHTLATRWAGLLDTLFILLFCCAFLYAFLQQALGWPGWAALAASIVFALVSYAFPRLFAPGALNGSVGYLPYLVVLIAMTIYLASRHAPAARAFGLGLVVFCISLTLRTVDPAICPRFPLGTHFLWHLLNGYLLWVVSREMLMGRARALSAGVVREESRKALVG